MYDIGPQRIRRIIKKLFNANATKHKMVYPLQFCPKSMGPLGIFDFCKNLIYTPLCASMFSIENEKLMKNKTIYCFLKVNSVIRWNKKYRYHVSGACCRVCSDDNLLGGQFKKLWDVVQQRENDDGNQESLARIDPSEIAIKLIKKPI